MAVPRHSAIHPHKWPAEHTPIYRKFAIDVTVKWIMTIHGWTNILKRNWHALHSAHRARLCGCLREHVFAKRAPQTAVSHWCILDKMWRMSFEARCPAKGRTTHATTSGILSNGKVYLFEFSSAKLIWFPFSAQSPGWESFHSTQPVSRDKK